MIIKPEISLIFVIEGCHVGEDGQKLLQRSIDAILFQSFPDYELILVDDGHCPDSSKICQKYANQDGRIKHRRFECEPAERYNHGAASSSGNYLCFMSKNDEWHPSALSELYKGMIRDPLPISRPFLVDSSQSRVFYGSKGRQKWGVLGCFFKNAWRYSRRGIKFLFRLMK